MFSVNLGCLLLPNLLIAANTKFTRLHFMPTGLLLMHCLMFTTFTLTTYNLQELTLSAGLHADMLTTSLVGLHVR